MTVPRVVLASASTGRLRVLRSAGVDPVVVVSGVDEDAVVAQLGGPGAAAEVVTELARAKADAVCRELDPQLAIDCVVIGCDSMLYVDGTLSGKPGTPEQALRQWNAMAGKSGQLFTGHCVVRMRDGEIAQTRTAAAVTTCLLYTSPSPRDLSTSRMPSSA